MAKQYFRMHAEAGTDDSVQAVRFLQYMQWWGVAPNPARVPFSIRAIVDAGNRMARENPERYRVWKTLQRLRGEG